MLQRYVVLPAYGFKSQALAASAQLRSFGPVGSLPAPGRVRRAGVGDPASGDTQFQVLDAVSEDGPKLVEMTPEAELAMRIAMPEFKIVPVVEYRTMRFMYHAERGPSASAGGSGSGETLRIVDSAGAPVRGAKVVAFTNFRTRAGDEGISDAAGRLRLRISRGTVLDRIYVYGPAGFWGRFARSFTLDSGGTISLSRIDLNSQSHALQNFRGGLPPSAGTGVVVGVLDTGIARDHPSLPNVAGGANLVLDELLEDPGASDDWGPAEVDGDHGTHVAGIVAARPSPALSFSGVAPGATIRSYRVFPHAGGGATNYDISNAIDRAVRDGCHIVNLSLGGGAEDEVVRAAIGSALNQGVVVIAAAGNGGRKPVSFPAALPFCIAVSAMGSTTLFPADSSEAADVAKPFGDPDRESFIAAFSNFGPQIDLTGPGVGVVSAVPPDGVGVMSGTSMACPAVAGFAAYLLADDATILNAQGEARSKRVIDRLYEAASKIGFGRDYEGFGSPRS